MSDSSDSENEHHTQRNRKSKTKSRGSRKDRIVDSSSDSDSSEKSNKRKKAHNKKNNTKRYDKDGEEAKKLDPLNPSTGKIEAGSFDTRLSLVDNIATLVEKEKAVLQLQLEEKEKALLDSQNLLKQLSKSCQTSRSLVL